MLVVALTGGIGSGKTTVSQLFEALGTPIVDTDIIARQLVAPGESALSKIVRQFGETILNPDGTLNRAQLRQTIFQSPDKKRLLESILHPLIRKEMMHQIAALTSPYCIVVIPLLVESGQMEFADRILVVDATEAAQLNRVSQRDNQAENEIAAIVASQASRDARLAVANDVIHNNSTLDELKQQVVTLHQKYLTITNSDE